MRYSNNFCTTYRTTTDRRRTDVVVVCRLPKLHAPPGVRDSLGLELVKGLLYQMPSSFPQQTLLEASIVTGASASCFGEQYRALLLYLHQTLDESTSNQQVQTTTVQQYNIQYTMTPGMQLCDIKLCTCCRW